MRDEKWEIYMMYLVSKLRLTNRLYKKHSFVIEQLHYIDFVWDDERFPMDKNRAKDGLYLRKEFQDDFDRPCSVLEMLTALAIRMEEEYIGDPNDPEPGGIFVEMLSNIGIWVENMKHDKMKTLKMVEYWMKRKTLQGEPVLILPILDDKPLCFQLLKSCEIWQQVQIYINEYF